MTCFRTICIIGRWRTMRVQRDFQDQNLQNGNQTPNKKTCALFRYHSNVIRNVMTCFLRSWLRSMHGSYQQNQLPRVPKLMINARAKSVAVRGRRWRGQNIPKWGFGWMWVEIGRRWRSLHTLEPIDLATILFLIRISLSPENFSLEVRR